MGRRYYANKINNFGITTPNEIFLRKEKLVFLFLLNVIQDQ